MTILQHNLSVILNTENIFKILIKRKTRRNAKLREPFSAIKKTTKKKHTKKKPEKKTTKATKKELVSFFLLLPYSRSLLGFHTTDHTLSEILNSLHYFFWRINLDQPRDKNQNAQWIPTLNSSLLLWTQHKKRKKESHTSYSI